MNKSPMPEPPSQPVTDLSMELEATSKRRRVSLACSQCRARKARCDGRTPACSTCVDSSQECTYVTVTSKKRGLPTGHAYDMELRTALFERIMGTLISRDKQLEKAILDVLRVSESSIESVWPEYPDDESVKEFLWDWNSSAVSREFDSLVGNIQQRFGASAGRRRRQSLSHLRPEIQKQTKIRETSAERSVGSQDAPNYSNQPLSSNHALSHPVRTAWKPSFMEASNSTLERNFERGSYVNLRNRSLGYMGRSSCIDTYGTEILAMNRLFRFSLDLKSISKSNDNARVSHSGGYEYRTFPADAMNLLNMFYITTHCWLPMLDCYSLVQMVYLRASISNATPNKQDIANSGLLWSVLAIASRQYWAENTFDQGNRSEVYASYAVEALSVLEGDTDDATTQLTITQCKLLVGLYLFGNGSWANSWDYVSSACRAALDYAFYLPSQVIDPPTQLSSEGGSGPASSAANAGNTASDEERVSQLQTWAACYVLDTVLASRLGRLPTLRAFEWAVPYVEVRGSDEYASYRGSLSEDIDNGVFANQSRCLSTYNELLKLIRILNLLITSPSYMPSQWCSPASNLQTIESIFAQLQSWENDLPSHCMLPTNRGSRRKLTPYLINLHMTHKLVLSLACSSVFGMKTGSQPENTQLVKYATDVFTITIRRVSWLLCIILASRSAYAKLLPPTLEYLVYAPVGCLDWLLDNQRQPVVRSVGEGWKSVINQVTLVLELIAPVWKSASIPLHLLCIRHPTCAYGAVEEPVSEHKLHVQSENNFLSQEAQSKEPDVLSLGMSVPPSMTAGVMPPEHKNRNAYVQTGMLPPGSSSVRNILHVQSHVSPRSFSMLNEANPPIFSENLGDLAMFNIKASSEEIRMEQFMQNLGYVGGVDNENLANDNLLLGLSNKGV